MRYSLAIVAIAGSAVARSGYGHGNGHSHPGKVVQHTHVVVETVVHTVYMTEGNGYGAPSKPTPSPESVYQAVPVVETIVYPAPPAASSHYDVPALPSSKYDSPPIIEQPTPTPQAPAPPAYTPPAAPASSPSSAPAPSAGEPEYMACINKWRQKMGKQPLAFNQTLAAGAEKSAGPQGMNGASVHIHFDGSYGQVLAPGGPEDFEKVFVGGWLCEVSSTPGLEGVCDDTSKIGYWNYRDQTDHNEICTSNDYQSVACANYKNMWECDFSYW